MTLLYTLIHICIYYCHTITCLSYSYTHCHVHLNTSSVNTQYNDIHTDTSLVYIHSIHVYIYWYTIVDSIHIYLYHCGSTFQWGLLGYVKITHVGYIHVYNGMYDVCTLWIHSSQLISHLLSSLYTHISSLGTWL